MNKDGLIKSYVPDNTLQKFMGMVWVLADMSEIDEDSEIYHHIKLLGDAVARQVFESIHKVSPQKKVHNDRKRFIIIFKTHYFQLLDLEYARKITQMDAKNINQVIRELVQNGFTIDEYLAWLFEDFLIENDKFRITTIKSVCSSFFVHSFIDQNRDIQEARKRQKVDDLAGTDLINRGRVLLREKMLDKDHEKMRKAIKDFGERCIMLVDLRKVVLDLEKQYLSKRK